VTKLRLNMVVHVAATDAWAAWTTTGAALYRVERAGELVLAK
jgi:hypothetical protein